MDLLLRRRLIMCKQDNVLRGYSISGNPTISGTILYLPGSEQREFIYTPQRFAPGSADWRIETKIRLHAFTPDYSEIISGVGDSGERNYVFCLQGVVEQNTQGEPTKTFYLYASSNGTRWNLLNGVQSISIGVLEEWRYIKIEKKQNRIGAYQRVEGGQWGTINTRSYNFTGVNTKVAFGGGFANRNTNCDIDLSETKIYIGNELWWKAM